ncbi:hypothetical protein [Amycolatopsis nigrescens]|uniref:hypothetical protein n=1 Tax=Amycolatopsis nigrescens TaxID=381445 RepID=UPI0012FA1153|nr:hypothetical protein [Amycolatopsis nigrescens]
MTTTTTSVKTENALLYLAVDLGDHPGLEDYGRNVDALVTLARHATFLSVLPIRVEDDAIGHPKAVAEIAILRTRMASPWVSVLADLARNSTPIAYGAGTLYALHSLLRLLMSWQRHRLELEEREVQLTVLRRRLLDASEQLADEGVRRSGEPRPANRNLDMASSVTDSLMNAAESLGTIQTADIIEPDDPRATGI